MHKTMFKMTLFHREVNTNSYSRSTHPAQMMMMRVAHSLVLHSTKLNTSYKAAWQSSSALSVQSCCLQTEATRPFAALQHFHKHISGFPLLENLPSLLLAHTGIICSPCHSISMQFICAHCTLDVFHLFPKQTV